MITLVPVHFWFTKKNQLILHCSCCLFHTIDSSAVLQHCRISSTRNLIWSFNMVFSSHWRKKACARSKPNYFLELKKAPVKKATCKTRWCTASWWSGAISSDSSITVSIGGLQWEMCSHNKIITVQTIITNMKLNEPFVFAIIIHSMQHSETGSKHSISHDLYHSKSNDVWGLA